MRFFTLMTLVLLTTIMGCQNTTNETTTNPPSTQVVEPPSPTSNVTILPVLPQADYEKLLTQTTSIDYLPHYFGQSISINDPREGAKNVSMIQQAAPPTQGCQPTPFAKFSFYDRDKQVLKEGDIYFAVGCTYYTFYNAEGIPEYANQMNDNGIVFFNNVITNLKARTQ